MNTSHLAPIVVGVDDSPASQQAVRWAAEEAGRRQLPLTLIHAGYYLYAPALSGATARLADREIEGYGATLLEKATAVVSKIDPAIDVSTEVHTTFPAELLMARSETASMLVLGSTGDSSVAGAILGSISQTVAAHAHCPVVVINQRRPMDVERTNTVVVGISPTPGGRQALRFALEEAERGRRSLLAVRSWGDVGWGALAAVDSGALLHDWQVAESKVLDECLDPVVGQFPGVKVDRRLSGVRPQWALEDAAFGADLLVVGCHRPDDHWFSRLGPVASWLLHRAPCPIAVVGRPPRQKQSDPATAGHAENSPVS